MIFPFNLQYPYLLALYPILLLLLVFLMRRDFIRFKTEKEKKEYEESKKNKRMLMLVSRSIIFLLLVVAIASPYTIHEKTVPGDASLKILADNSSSFDVFEKNIAEDLKNKLEGKIPVSLKYIASGERSSIGDGILNNIQGGDNIMVVSDGNNNYGRDLGDMIIFASMLNSTISTINIEPVKDDMGIIIEGPSEVIEGTENDFFVKVNKVGIDPTCRLSVTVDGARLHTPGCIDQKLSYEFDEGYHEIIAELEINDFFEKNNVFYKIVSTVPRPKILFVSEEPSQLLRALVQIYDVRLEENIPPDLSMYRVVILNDIGADKLKESTDKLSNYVLNGNGLFVVGGESSYDRGSYKGSLFETLLPVQVGKGEGTGESDTNIVVIMDISGTSGLVFGSGSANTKLDVTKALTLSVLGDFKENDKVEVIAFNNAPYMVSPLSTFSEKVDLVDKVKRLQSGGGTLLFKALRRAEWTLENEEGSRNIIVISDGIDAAPDVALDIAKSAAGKGINTYTVGVGADTNSAFLKQLAQIGHGVYFEPSEAQNLRILFGKPEDDPKKDALTLAILDRNHFITTNVELGATISGLNFVVPKPAARALVTTSEGDTILAVWRFGLGRVVSLTTDDGSKWSGELLSKKNSQLITKAINWAIGDLSRNKDFDVEVKDTTLGKSTQVNVISNTAPSSEGLSFSKVDTNKYTASLIPERTGFHSVLGAKFAVSYNDEYAGIGLNPELADLVVVSGGYIFDPNDIDGIVEAVKKMSRRTKIDILSYRWPFILAALILLLAEISIRRLKENLLR